MSVPVFSQNVIAVIWDFDKTLIPGNMQQPLFKRYGVEEANFWDEVNTLPAFYESQGNELMSTDTMYLNHVLTYVREGIFDGLSNKILRELGDELVFYPGMPEFMEDLRTVLDGNQSFRRHEITLEHYVISTGFRQTILGSPVAPSVKHVWGCEFHEALASPGYLDTAFPEPAGDEVLRAVAYAIDNTTKTRAIFEINKGANEFPAEIDVNATIAPEDRRVPFENMIYVADGPSDVPVFSVLNQYGGRTFAVYNPEKDSEFEQVALLRDQLRVQDSGPANYTEKSHTAKSLRLWVRQIAEAIVDRRERRLHESVGRSPRHLPDPPSAPEGATDGLARTEAARIAVEPKSTEERSSGD